MYNSTKNKIKINNNYKLPTNKANLTIINFSTQSIKENYFSNNCITYISFLLLKLYFIAMNFEMAYKEKLFFSAV